MAKNGTIAYVTQLPDCNFCQLLTRRLKAVMQEVTVTKAKYDFRTRTGQWAFGCEAHYQAYKMHRELGTGKGQMLQLREPAKS